MTPTDLRTLLAACREAYAKMTKGEWSTQDDGDGLAKIVLPVAEFPTFAHHNPENAEGIVTLVNAFPQLAEALERRQKLIERIENEAHDGGILAETMAEVHRVATDE